MENRIRQYREVEEIRQRHEEEVVQTQTIVQQEHQVIMQEEQPDEQIDQKYTQRTLEEIQ